MTALEMFAEQLKVVPIVTFENIVEKISDGRITENSALHLKLLDHVGERQLYMMVFRKDDTGECDEVLNIESCFESEVEDVITKLEHTHQFNGYGGQCSNVPRFHLRRRSARGTT